MMLTMFRLMHDATQAAVIAEIAKVVYAGMSQGRLLGHGPEQQ